MFSVSYSILFRESSERNSISIPSLVIFSYKMTFENPAYVPESNRFNYDWTTFSDQEKHNQSMIYLKKFYPDMYKHILSAAELSKVRIVENLRSSKEKKEAHNKKVIESNEKLEKLYNNFIESELDAGIVLSEELMEILDNVDQKVTENETIIEFSNELAVLDDLIEKQVAVELEVPPVIDLTVDDDYLPDPPVEPIPIGNIEVVDISGCEDFPVSPPALGRKRKLEEIVLTKIDEKDISLLSDLVFNIDADAYAQTTKPFQNIFKEAVMIDI
mmetsp:Transcript_31927/g.40939  ORF Transcript_31927/g.40939 Transcript_31927/m.40939 type:complete len:273 (+) Transcript_31927:569-1387(+)